MLSHGTASMEKNGFSDVTTGYVITDFTPDDPKYSAQMAETMIEAMRQNDLEAIQSAHSVNAEKAIAAVNAKYDERISLYLAKGLHQGKQKLDADEFLNVMEVPLEELVQDVLNGTITDGKTQAALLKAYLRLK